MILTQTLLVKWRVDTYGIHCEITTTYLSLFSFGFTSLHVSNDISVKSLKIKCIDQQFN